MWHDGKKAGARAWTHTAQRVGKVILIVIVVIATAGAAGSFSLNICPACGTNLRPDENMQQEPEAIAVKPNVNPDEVPQLRKSVQRTP
jgi:hypothetical protein